MTVWRTLLMPMRACAEVKNIYIMKYFSFHNRCLLIDFCCLCVLYRKCRDRKLCGRYSSVFILSSVHAEHVWGLKGTFQRIGTRSSAGESLILCLHWHGHLTLYFFLMWFYFFWDPQMRHICEQHMLIFSNVCILSNCRKENKRWNHRAQ